jgi:hypothetical protein
MVTFAAGLLLGVIAGIFGALGLLVAIVRWGSS